MVSRTVYRFAPSPNGFLHLGHAFSALFTYKAAREDNGRFLLRIEDIDRIRCKDEFIYQIYDDLAWLGLEWQQPVRRQSDHMADYKKALDRLAALGVTYKCFATRTEIRLAAERQHGAGKAPCDPDGALVYPGLYRGLESDKTAQFVAEARPFCIRLDMKKALDMVGGSLTFFESGSGPQQQTGKLVCQPEAWGDVIITRKDVPTSYHLSVVVDDALQGVTRITRGQDLFYATAVHRLLQTLLELPEPQYTHHSLIRDQTGRRLSKSAVDKSLKSLRQEGCSREEIYALIGLALV